MEWCSLPYFLYMQIDLKQASYDNFLLSAKMTYKLSWKIIERKIAEPGKMIVSTGHRYSWCQQRRHDKYLMMQYTIMIRKLNSLTWWLLSVWIWQGHNWKMIIKLPAAEAAQTICMKSLGLLWSFMPCFLCGFCNRKSDELAVLYLKVSSTIKEHNQ